MRSLPLAGHGRPERADAQRNREAILDAAATLHARDGADGLTMDAVATLAGVGKGTVYRRFTDKAGLASALLDQRVRAMHAGMLQGPPPLGPGATPRERLAAFVDAYCRHILTNIDLVLVTESSSPRGRLDRPSYPFWRHHVQILLAAAGTPSPRFRAEAVMAMLAAAQLRDWTHEQGRTADDVVTRLQAAVDALAVGTPTTGQQND